MKKIELCFVMIILAAIAVLFSGCEEQLAKRPDLPDLRNELINLQPQDQVIWEAKYGDSLDSKQVVNILLVIQTINNQAKVLQQLNDRLVKLEDSNNVIRYGDAVNLERKAVYDGDPDPNYIHWTTEEYYHIHKRNPSK